MGGLRKYMPITYVCSLVGSLALIGFPGFSGFFSKDSIIEAVHLSNIPGAGIAYFAVLAGVFVTALYSFRMFFLVFHGEERMDAHTKSHLHESPLVVTAPLILLAIPSVVIGYITVGPVLFEGYFQDSIYVIPSHDVLGQLGRSYDGPFAFIIHGVAGPAFWLAMAGLISAWYIYLKKPSIADAARKRFSGVYNVLMNNYGFDDFNDKFFAGGSRGLGRILSNVGDATVIDGWIVNGTARTVGWASGIMRHLQSGLMYHYAFAMIIGLSGLLTWVLFK